MKNLATIISDQSTPKYFAKLAIVKNEVVKFDHNEIVNLIISEIGYELESNGREKFEKKVEPTVRSEDGTLYDLNGIAYYTCSIDGIILKDIELGKYDESLNKVVWPGIFTIPDTEEIETNIKWKSVENDVKNALI
jgi:hypothetical protein